MKPLKTNPQGVKLETRARILGFYIKNACAYTTKNCCNILYFCVLTLNQQILNTASQQNSNTLFCSLRYTHPNF